MSAEWNSLEIAKLITSLLTPFTLAVGGIFIHRITKKFEHTQWRSQKLIEKRLMIYDDIAPLLNDMMCYYCYVGHWRDVSPKDVVSWKRIIDKKVALASPLFSPDFLTAFRTFQKACFSTFKGWGQDAKLNTNYEHRKRHHKDWKAEWDSCFSSTPTEPQQVLTLYEDIMRIFATDIGVNERNATKNEQQPLINVK